jgi:chaperonin GroES
MKKIKPLFDYLLIEPMEKETTLPSGIVIPDTAKEKPQQGKVIAVGPGAKDKDGTVIPMEVSVDDVVMYKKWGGTEIQMAGKDYVLVKQEDLLAVLED